MTQRSRAFMCCALLGVVLLSGCAAGSPAVVVPTASVESALELAAPESTVPAVTVDAPEVAIAQEPSTEVSASTTETASQAAPAPDASGTASFSQSVPAPVVQTPGDEGFAVVAESASQEQAPAAQVARPAPPPEDGTGLSQIIEGGANGRLEVALTFDAGADTGYGPQILDFLRDEGISATFGMTGTWAQANPDLVQRMVDEGHQLMNHTWDHSSLTGANTGLPALTPEQVTAQLGDTEAVVRDLTGYEMRPYFRPPYGDYDEPTLGYLYNDGYYLSIWWTCDSHGWAGWGAQEIIDYCTTNIAEDEILLLHVGAAAAGDFEALPGLIQFFRDSGYAFVTVEQMLQP